MSQENVKITRRSIDAFNRRDVDAFMEVSTSDFELFPALVGEVEGGSFRGRAGMAAYFEAAAGTWEEFRLLPDEFRDLGDTVLWLGRMEGRGRASGVLVSAPQGAIV
jgi:ketosteroid isomerase-like protein